MNQDFNSLVQHESQHHQPPPHHSESNQHGIALVPNQHGIYMAQHESQHPPLQGHSSINGNYFQKPRGCSGLEQLPPRQANPIGCMFSPGSKSESQSVVVESVDEKEIEYNEEQYGIVKKVLDKKWLTKFCITSVSGRAVARVSHMIICGRVHRVTSEWQYLNVQKRTAFSFQNLNEECDKCPKILLWGARK